MRWVQGMLEGLPCLRVTLRIDPCTAEILHSLPPTAVLIRVPPA